MSAASPLTFLFFFFFFFLQLENPDPYWFSDKAWDELCRMCDLHGFKDFRFVNLLNYALLESLLKKIRSH